MSKPVVKNPGPSKIHLRGEGHGFGLPLEGASRGFPILRQCAGVITFLIGDLGFVLRTPTLRAGSRFRIEINKAQTKDLFPIPQSAFLNPQLSCSNTPKQLTIFIGKARELWPSPKDRVFDVENAPASAFPVVRLRRTELASELQ